MKLMIKYRLFLAMLTATGAVVICMFLIMQWSIGRGFLSYVNTIEKERFEKLADQLEQSYATRGDWQFLRDDPSTWFRMIQATLPREWTEGERQEQRRARRGLSRQQLPFPNQSGLQPPPGPGPEFGNLSGMQPPPRRGLAFRNRSGQPFPPRLHRFDMRVFLLDANRQPVVGPAGVSGEILFKKIVSDRQTVGYLGMLPRQRLTDTHQLLFVRQQKVALGLVAVVMFLVSAALSLPLANRLVLPIRRLAASMHRLASGKFDTRVPVGPQDELGQLAQDFNTLALSLEKNEKARRQWVADISHELRTPLAILRGEVEAIQDGVRRADPDAMRSLHAEVMRLSRLVDDLYQLSLFDIGALTYKKTDLDLRELLADAVASFQPEFEQKGIALSEELGGGGELPIFADPGRLHQLFDNLLENSLKYTDPGGELSVRLGVRGKVATVELADSAPGVGEQELERLFDRLYRVESSRNRETGGAGLGLAICKNIVEAHEGTICALPSPRGGVLIRIELPLTGGRT